MSEADKTSPRPWRVSESNGGKKYIYDRNNKLVFVPNVSASGKTQKELEAIYQLIVVAVNGMEI